MFAIGRSGEDLPTLGASRPPRTIIGGRTVLNLLPRAALVVLALGGSTGIWWEVERAVERVIPHRLLLLTFGASPGTPPRVGSSAGTTHWVCHPLS